LDTLIRHRWESEKIKLVARKNHSDEFRRQALDLDESTRARPCGGSPRIWGGHRGAPAAPQCDELRSLNAGEGLQPPPTRRSAGARCHAVRAGSGCSRMAFRVFQVVRSSRPKSPVMVFRPLRSAC